ncbi:MAG: NHL repeat-containing protein [Planctomycetota bacterium]
MFGGIAVAKNLLCIAHSDVRGKVFLVDLDERRLVSVWDYGPDDGGYADAGGVAMAPDFTIYVADTRNDLVRRFSPFGKEIGRLGRPADRPPGAARRDRNGVLDRPRAVAVAAGVAYVACGERKLVRGLQRVAVRDGMVLPPLRSFGESEGRFGAPRGVWAGASGVLVADTLHGVVQRFAADGGFVGHFTTSSRPDESSRPAAVIELAGGDVMVADQGDHRGLKRFSKGGEPRSVPSATEAQCDEPVALAVDERGRVYVLDRDGERVQRLNDDLTFDLTVVDLAEVLHEP